MPKRDNAFCHRVPTTPAPDAPPTPAPIVPPTPAPVVTELPSFACADNSSFECGVNADGTEGYTALCVIRKRNIVEYRNECRKNQDIVGLGPGSKLSRQKTIAQCGCCEGVDPMPKRDNAFCHRVPTTPAPVAPPTAAPVMPPTPAPVVPPTPAPVVTELPSFACTDNSSFECGVNADGTDTRRSNRSSEASQLLGTNSGGDFFSGKSGSAKIEGHSKFEQKGRSCRQELPVDCSLRERCVQTSQTSFVRVACCMIFCRTGKRWK
jgi:hypothetical protein